MENTTKIGLNRTGLDMSPIDSKKLLEATQNFLPDVTSTDMPTIDCIRSDTVGEMKNQNVGSVPLPASFKGATNSIIEKLSGRNIEILIDKLSERAAFERMGTRLYDALISKCIGLGTITTQQLALLQQFRAEEVAHYQLIAKAMESIGADPTAQTPCADMIGVTSMGIMQAITDPRSTLSQSLNALLTAEMTDNAGWELLIALTEEFGDLTLARDFQNALDEEGVHLAIIKLWLKESILAQVIK